MKSLKELRPKIKINCSPQASSIAYLAKQKIDYNVYLPSKNKNLQRDFVWNIDQKRELIMSVFLERHIPALSLINCYTESTNDLYQVIDGKQRLSTLISFYNNEFDIIIDNKSYYLKDLDEDYYNHYKRGHHLKYNLVNELRPNEISDEFKIEWFKLLNYAGTPQEKEYLESL